MTERTLDYVDGIVLSAEQARKHTNRLTTLGDVSRGLAFLAKRVSSLEAEIREKELREGEDPGRVVGGFGNLPILDGVDQGLVSMMFHWYAVSLCNFVGLIGWIANQEGLLPDRWVYRKSVCGPLLVYRNKVAGHFAEVDPWTKGKDESRWDTTTDTLTSTMPNLVWDDGKFSVGGPTMRRGKANKPLPTRNHPYYWSVTARHAHLAARFWPEPWPVGSRGIVLG